MTAWQQGQTWQRRVADAGLGAGIVSTARALAGLADEQGVAAPGLAQLAAVSHCSVDTAHRRLLRLERARFARRAGRRSGVLPRSAVIRWQLVIPAAPDVVDVGQRLPGGGQR